MSLIHDIDKNKVPSHVAIIMDGNGRWAQQHGKVRVMGHSAGVDSVKLVLRAADNIGVKFLTLYAFSIENWNRPKYEVNAIISLIMRTLKNDLPDFMENNVRFETIGDHSRLTSKSLATLHECIDATKNNTGITFVLAFSYGARNEITVATQRIAEAVKNGTLSLGEIDESTISKYLYTSKYPDPEFIIRTSGEYRLSNFLLWQSAYSEFYFTDLFWPDFHREEFFAAILDFQKRERRFGKTSAQVKK